MPTFEHIKRYVNKRTKVIIIIHMQGQPIDYLDKLKKFCKFKKIILIEDAAPALGSYFKDKPLGSFGDFATFSLHETKNYTSGLGGLLVVNNKKFKRLSDLLLIKVPIEHMLPQNLITIKNIIHGSLLVHLLEWLN